MDGVVGVKAQRQGNEQLGVRQLSHLMAMDASGEARPKRLPSGWLRPRSWVRTHRPPISEKGVLVMRYSWVWPAPSSVWVWRRRGSRGVEEVVGRPRCLSA